MNENNAVTLMKITFNKNEKYKFWDYNGIGIIYTNELNKILEPTGETIKKFYESGKDLFKELDLHIEITLDKRIYLKSYLNIEAYSNGIKDIMRVAINNQLEMAVESILKYVKEALKESFLDYDLSE